MNIPASFDLSFCVGWHLEQLAMGKHDLQLNFESGACVSLWCNVLVLRSGAVVAEWNGETGWSSLEFQGVLNQRVEQGQVIAGSIIELQFASQLALRLCADDQQLESMQIRTSAPGAPIIII